MLIYVYIHYKLQTQSYILQKSKENSINQYTVNKLLTQNVYQVSQDSRIF